ncbi:MAG: HD domain-containing phosphohydrolase [Candidatus Melainabacteria bacterium]|nr:HD domain-containing phosphohydrolase [Candidatus Melainabacteria bacterium]
MFQEVAHRFDVENDAPAPHCPSFNDLMIAASKGIDLLEGRPLRHGIRVAVLTGLIAQRMSLSKREMAPILYGALLHDVGLPKIAYDLLPHLPDGLSIRQLFYSHTLMNIPGLSQSSSLPVIDPEHLPPNLLRILQNHPKAAAGFLDAVHLSSDIKEMVATSHELCSGQGYPLGLSKRQISMGARMITFADVVEALLQEAKGAQNRHQLVEELLGSGPLLQAFDAEVVQAFKSLVIGPDSDDHLLTMLYSLDVERQLRNLLHVRNEPVSGVHLLDIARAMGQLADTLMPEYTENHAESVAQIASGMALAIGIPSDQRGELVVAALLHDIGKLAIPLETLTNRGTLSSQEWRIIHDHPHYTEVVLKGLPGFKNVITWASEHHERLNGSGYHCKRKGYEISVGARILAIADVFNALTTPRPYRPYTYDPLDALPVINQGRSRLYDSELVNILRSVILSKEVPIPAIR